MTDIQYINGRSYLEQANHLLQAPSTPENIQKIQHFATWYFVEDPTDHPKHQEKITKQNHRSLLSICIATSITLGSLCFSCSPGFFAGFFGLLWTISSELSPKNKTKEENEYALARETKKLLNSPNLTHEQLRNSVLPLVRGVQARNLEDFTMHFADRQREERRRAEAQQQFHNALEEANRRRQALARPIRAQQLQGLQSSRLCP